MLRGIIVHREVHHRKHVLQVNILHQQMLQVVQHVQKELILIQGQQAVYHVLRDLIHQTVEVRHVLSVLRGISRQIREVHHV